MLKLITKRQGEKTNLIPVLAMFLNTSIENMLIKAGFPANYNPQSAEDSWATAKIIIQKNNLRWAICGTEGSIRMPEDRITIPSDGSGIMFTWSYPKCGGLGDSGVIKSVCIEAFDGGLVFDPCFAEPIGAMSYQQALEDGGGKIVKIIRREQEGA